MMYPSQSRTTHLMLATLLAITLTGCEQHTDLDAYIQDVKRRDPGEPPSIPQITAYKPYAYPGHDRDPFDQTVVAQKVQTQSVTAGTVKIDPNRVKEYLESFPLDTLSMVGSLQQNGTLWALVQTPDGTIQRVREGNHLGQNHGKVENISSTSIRLIEIVPDGFGGHMESPAAISLKSMQP